MGKARRLKEARRDERECIGSTWVANCEVRDLDDISVVFHDERFEGMFYEITVYDDIVDGNVCDPYGVARPRPAADIEKISKTAGLLTKKASAKIGAVLDDIDNVYNDTIRTLIWQDDDLRKYVREYHVFIDGSEWSNLPEYSIGFSVSVGDGKYITFWFDDALSSIPLDIDAGATREIFGEMTDGLCVHCARREGVIDDIGIDQAFLAGGRAPSIFEKLSVLVERAREIVFENLVLQVVKALTDGWTNRPEGQWLRHEMSFAFDDDIDDDDDFAGEFEEHDDEYEDDEGEDSFAGDFADCDDDEYEYGDADTREVSYVYRAKKRRSYEYDTYDLMDRDDPCDKLVDISNDIKALSRVDGKGMLSIPKGYRDIEHGTVYVRDDLESTLSDGCKRIVLTDSVDQVELALDPESGAQKVIDRALLEDDDPTELVRFACKCEEMYGNGIPEDLYR